MRSRSSDACPRFVLLCGYYGEHNLGDDALLQVLLDQLPGSLVPLVTAHDQEMVQQRFGVETVDRRSLRAVIAALSRSEALVLGGGSLLQDATSFRSLVYYALLILLARLQGRPVLLWGQGLGPLRRGTSHLLTRLVLPLASGITWRDEASAAQATRWGITSACGSDPVWSLHPQPWRGEGGPIVLCWRPVSRLQTAGWRPYLQALAQLAEALDRPVLWLPFHQDQDCGLLDQLDAAGLMPKALKERSCRITAVDPAEAMGWFSSAALVIAMRLHGLILAALAGSPCAALSYDPKVAAAAEGLGCSWHDLSLPPPADLAEQWIALADQAPDPAALERLRAGSAVHRTLLLRLDAAGSAVR